MSGEPESPRPLPAAAVAALSAGRMVEAVRHVREAERIGLFEARQRIEAWIGGHPGLAAQFEADRRRLRRRLIGWVLVADALIVAGVLWWFFGR